jgi:hypothetical protein
MFARQQVDDLSFGFVSPLQTDDTGSRHSSKPNRGKKGLVERRQRSNRLLYRDESFSETAPKAG